MIAYREDRCALNGPLVLSAVFWPAAFIASVVAFAVTGSGLLWLPALAAALGLVYSLAPVLAMMSRRISIRVDDDGIQIGNVRGRPDGPLPPQAQRRVAFAVPWSAVQRAEIVTDRGELRRLRRAGQDIGVRRAPVVQVGRLWSPQMRAALVLNVDVERAAWPQFLDRGESRQTRLGTATSRTQWRRSAVWLAPTRHPRELREVLTRAEGSGLVRSSGDGQAVSG